MPLKVPLLSAVMFLGENTLAQEPPSADVSEVPQSTVTTEQDDWLSKISIANYGEGNGLFLTELLCTYNQHYGLVADCDELTVGQPVLVPDVKVLECMLPEEARLWECKKEDSVASIQASLAKNPTYRDCALAMEAQNPGIPPLSLVMLAKVYGKEFPSVFRTTLDETASPERGEKRQFMHMCSQKIDLKQPFPGGFESLPADWAMVDEKGKIHVYDTWGSWHK